MTLLYDRLLARASKLFDAVRADGMWDVFPDAAARGYRHPHSFYTPQNVADVVERSIVRFVEQLVPDPAIQRAVLDHPELASGWEISDVDDVSMFEVTGIRGDGEKLDATWKKPNGEEYRQWKAPIKDALRDLHTCEVHSFGFYSLRPTWPLNVSAEDLATTLRATGDAAAMRLAEAFQVGDVFPVSFPELRTFRLRPELYTKEVPRRVAKLSSFAKQGEGEEIAPMMAIGDPLLSESLSRWGIARTALVVSVEKRARALASPYEAVRFAYGLLDVLPSSAAAGRSLRDRVVEAALARNTEDPLAGDPSASAELERVLLVHLSRLRDAIFARDTLNFVGADRPLADGDEATKVALRDSTRLVDGMLSWDASLAGTLEAFGETGRTTAANVRTKARLRVGGDTVSSAAWSLWSDMMFSPAGCRFAVLLAIVLWRDVVRPKLEQARKNPAAVVRVVAVETIGLLAFQGPRAQRNGQQAIVFPQESGWSLTPTIDTELAAAVLKGTGHLSSEVAIDLFEWLVTAAHKQYVDVKGDFRNLVIEGGWSELARLLGTTRSGSAEKVRTLVLAFAHLRYDLRGWRGNLLTYAETKAAPGRKACVSLTLGDMLLQGFTFTLKEASGSAGQLAREDRQLVPILGKTAVVGAPASYGAQRRMTWALSTLLRSRAVELARDGGVSLSPHDWADLASKAGAPRSPTLLGKVQGAWEEGDESKGIPPLIVRNGGLVTLHESRKDALNFFKQAGETSQRQSVRGKKAVRTRSPAPKGKKPA